ncbi:hypothetical protein MHYP_G00048680 [Metynnis hypsauchen]
MICKRKYKHARNTRITADSIWYSRYSRIYSSLRRPTSSDQLYEEKLGELKMKWTAGVKSGPYRSVVVLAVILGMSSLSLSKGCEIDKTCTRIVMIDGNYTGPVKMPNSTCPNAPDSSVNDTVCFFSFDTVGETLNISTTRMTTTVTISGKQSGNSGTIWFPVQTASSPQPEQPLQSVRASKTPSQPYSQLQREAIPSSSSSSPKHAALPRVVKEKAGDRLREENGAKQNMICAFTEQLTQFLHQIPEGEGRLLMRESVLSCGHLQDGC